MSEEKLILSMSEDRLRQIVEDSVKRALKDIGLEDENAGHDIKDLRDLIENWRQVRGVALKTFATWLTLGVLGIFTLGLWRRFGGE